MNARPPRLEWRPSPRSWTARPGTPLATELIPYVVVSTPYGEQAVRVSVDEAEVIEREQAEERAKALEGMR